MNRLDEEIQKILNEDTRKYGFYGDRSEISRYFNSLIKKTGFKHLKVEVENENLDSSLYLGYAYLRLKALDNYLTGYLELKKERQSENTNLWAIEWKTVESRDQQNNLLFQTCVNSFPDNVKEYYYGKYSYFYFYTNPVLGRTTDEGNRSAIKNLAKEFNNILMKIDIALESYFKDVDKELDKQERTRI